MNVTNKSVMVKSSAVLSDAVMHFFMRGVLNTIVVFCELLCNKGTEKQSTLQTITC